MSDLSKRLRSGAMSHELRTEAADEIERMEGLLTKTRDGVAVGPGFGPLWTFDEYGEICTRHFRGSVDGWVYGAHSWEGVQIGKCYSTHEAITKAIREAKQEDKAKADYEQLRETEEIVL